MTQTTLQKPTTALFKRVPVGARGQIVLPIEMRRALGIEQGDQVTLKLEEGKITLETQQQVHANLLGKYAYIKESLADELHLERRAEAAKKWL